MITDGELKYVFYSSGPDGLYDLTKDPKELNNLINNPKYKRELKQMKHALKQWMKRSNDTYLAYWLE